MQSTIRVICEFAALHSYTATTGVKVVEVAEISAAPPLGVARSNHTVLPKPVPLHIVFSVEPPPSG